MRVATPEALVVLVTEVKEPFASVLLQVTVFPLAVTALSFASASCALIVTVPPAVGE